MDYRTEKGHERKTGEFQMRFAHYSTVLHHYYVPGLDHFFIVTQGVHIRGSR